MAYAPQNGPAGDKNAHQRSIVRIIRPINGSFVGRIQYAPTQRHENAVRFAYPTPWHAPSAMRFSHATTVKQSNALRFTYSIARNAPTAPRLGYAPMWDGEGGKILSLVTSEKS